MSRAGIYIHIPFCRARCSYCDFATGAYEGALAERYVRAVAREVEAFARAAADEEVDTIYFGGGTPSLLTHAQVARVIASVRRRFRVAEGAEVTLEMNPGTVTRETLRGFRDAGINRASFGAQTFDERELKRLGRTHTADDTRRTLALLRETGFTNISFDLIAGLPEQTLGAWERNLDEALALRPEHLSLYLLEVHESATRAPTSRLSKRRAPPSSRATSWMRETEGPKRSSSACAFSRAASTSRNTARAIIATCAPTSPKTSHASTRPDSSPLTATCCA